MNNESRIVIWFKQIRGPFLVLPPVLVLIGIAAAYRDGFSPHWYDIVFLMTGVLLAHISVNLFNELSDYETKIDELTVPTPFSGGSGMMQTGKTDPKIVAGAAYGTLAAAAAIGCYFCVTGSRIILLLMAAGGIAIRFYTSHISKWLLGEIISGLTLGSFVVLGSYLALTGRMDMSIVFISIPPGILTTLLLFLNEFPDAQADKAGGRYHLVIHFGKKKSARLYVALLALIYGLILLAPFVTDSPLTILVALATLPCAVSAAVITLKHHEFTKKLIPALALNVLVVILTDLLIAVGYFISK